jgi:biotin/methionine sulfoxide reductase
VNDAGLPDDLVSSHALPTNLGAAESAWHSSHWGAFSVSQNPNSARIIPDPKDPSPSPLLGNFVSPHWRAVRIGQPMIRAGWLNSGAGSTDRRGRDEFVPVSWDTAANHVAQEIRRVIGLHGSAAIFGGSYGWSSAGRFHHAQSQLHRFLNCLGGYVRSVDTYSAAAALVILPRVLGSYEDVSLRQMTWDEVASSTEILLAFGGMAPKNSMVAAGGNSRHVVPGALLRASRGAMKSILVSPLHDDFPREIPRDWLPLRPGTDVALMLALIHFLITSGQYDRDYVDRYCVGFAELRSYCLGESDGQPKSASWAAAICGLPAERISALGQQLVGRRVLITVAQSLQRGEHGEQPVWAGIALAAVLGQLGLEGGGFVYGLGSMGSIGKPPVAVSLPTLPHGANGVRDYIPVARMADMLLQPGEPYNYNGARLRYPDIKLVYWAGGNPFHHHQDINRLRQAFVRPDTIIVHESVWTATARHADIVLPATLSSERDDLGAAATDSMLVAMQRYATPWGEARDDYDIFTDLAQRLGVGKKFTEGRTSRDWIKHLYEEFRRDVETIGHSAPSFDEFWESGQLELPVTQPNGGVIRSFRRNPTASPLKTPSGRVELFSTTIDGFGYPDCVGHPAWYPPTDGAGSAARERYPLLLISNNPKARLHSQLDFGNYSVSCKIGGREPARMNPHDASRRRIRTGDVVRLFNDRGSCLAAISVDAEVAEGVVQLSTGAWYDPEDAELPEPMCRHGNPNVLTRDKGTSSLGQGCSGAITCVEIARFEGDAPEVRAFVPPSIRSTGGSATKRAGS